MSTQFKPGDSVVILCSDAHLFGTYGVVESVGHASDTLAPWYFRSEDGTDSVINVSIDDYDFLLAIRPDQLRLKKRVTYGTWFKEHGL